MSEVRLHPETDLLMDYSSGSLTPAQSVAVSAHLYYCRRCQNQAASLNEIGGSLLAEMEPATLSETCMADVIAQLDNLELATELDGNLTPAPAFKPAVANGPSLETDKIPPLVNKLLPEAGIDWRRLSPSLKVARLPVGEKRFELALHQIKAGGKAPAHDHRGMEITVVLQGSFSDDEGVYHEGDFIIREPGHVHTPVATANAECICLSVLEAPIRMVGGFKRMLNPFLAFDPA